MCADSRSFFDSGVARLSVGRLHVPVGQGKGRGCELDFVMELVIGVPTATRTGTRVGIVGVMTGVWAGVTRTWITPGLRARYRPVRRPVDEPMERRRPAGMGASGSQVRRSPLADCSLVFPKTICDYPVV